MNRVELVNTLRRCTGNLEQAKRLHSYIELHHPQDTFLANLLIDAYARCGRPEQSALVLRSLEHPNEYSWNTLIQAMAQNDQLHSACQIFHTMPSRMRNIVSWNSIVAGCIRAEQLRQAADVISLMPSHNVVTLNTTLQLYTRMNSPQAVLTGFNALPERTEVSWSSVVTANAQHGDMQQARLFFDRMPQWSVIAWTGIVTGYGQIGDLQEAKEIFNRMPERNQVSWNAMLSAFAQNGNFHDAKSMFDSMANRDVISWNALITAFTCIDPAVSGVDHSECEIVFERIPARSTVTFNCMIQAYALRGDMNSAEELFRLIAQPSVVSWTAMLTGFGRNGDIETAKQVFFSIPTRTIVSWNAMLLAAAQSGDVELANTTFNKMPQWDSLTCNSILSGYVTSGSIADQLEEGTGHLEVLSNPKSWTILLGAFADSGQISKARELFEQMPVKDLVSWNAMMQAYGNYGSADDARSTFERMPRRNPVSWICLLIAFARNRLVQQAREVFNKSPMLAADMLTAILTANAQSGDIEQAWSIFDIMPSRDTVAWTAMIVAYAYSQQEQCEFHRNNAEAALELFKMMKLEGAKPSEMTFTAVLAACSHLGILSSGREQFQSMIADHGVAVPHLHHYCSMIDMLGRAGRLAEAEELVKSMPYQADDTSWTALLNACKLQGDVWSGARAAEHAIADGDSLSGPYMLLSDLYRVILNS